MSVSHCFIFCATQGISFKLLFTSCSEKSVKGNDKWGQSQDVAVMKRFTWQSDGKCLYSINVSGMTLCIAAIHGSLNSWQSHS